AAARARAEARAPARLRCRDAVPLPAVARPRDADDLQRRAPVREALAVARRRTRTCDPRRAVLLPGAARLGRAGARVVAALDDGRLRGGEAAQRGLDVGGRLPGVLARTEDRAPVVRTAHRPRDCRGAGDG